MPRKTLAEIAEVPPEAVAATKPAASTEPAAAEQVLSLAVDDRERKASETALAIAAAAADRQHRVRSLLPANPRSGRGRGLPKKPRGWLPRRHRRQRSQAHQGFEHRKRSLLSGSAKMAGQAGIRLGRQAARPVLKSRHSGYRPAASDAMRAQRLADKRRPLRLRPLASVRLVKSGAPRQSVFRAVFAAGLSSWPRPRPSFALVPALARAYGQTLGHASTRALARKTVRVSGSILAQTAILTAALAILISVQSYRLSLRLALAAVGWQRARRDRAEQNRRRAEEAAQKRAEAAAVAAAEGLGEGAHVEGVAAEKAGADREEAHVEGVAAERAGADREEAEGSRAAETPPAAADLRLAPMPHAPTAPAGKPPPQTLPYSFCRRYGVLIEKDAGDHLMVLRRAGGPVEALLEIHRITGGAQLKVREIPEEEFSETLDRYYESGSWQSLDMMDGIGDDLDLNQIADSLPEPSDLMESDDEAPVIRLINAMLTEAIRKNASDIHVEPFEKRLEVRFRIDGVMHRLLEPPREIGPMLTSRIKVMANLDIAEKRVPQDGRISLRVAGRPVDVRVSSLPSGHGERVVMRLLNKEKGRLDLDYLGMEEEVQGRLKDLLKMPHGILLITGPTGSGKTHHPLLGAGLAKRREQDHPDDRRPH